MLLPRGRGRPVAFLLLAAPVIAELCWGTTTVSQAAGLLAQIGLYGCGAILIRETVVRWAGGWPSILLLGAAYGAVEEGLLEPTWFTPRLFPHPYGVAAGVYWPYALFNIGYHAIFSIGIPIALTETLFPDWRHRPWLGRTGLTVTGSVYVVNAAAIGVAWYTVLQKAAFGIPARLHLPQQAATGVLIVALVIAAHRVAPARRQPVARLPSAPRLALLTAGGALIWFAILLLATGQDVIGWLPPPVPLALIAVAATAAVRWAWRRPVAAWAQLIAACTGALLVQAAAGFAATGLHGSVNIIGKAIINAAELAALALLWQRAGQLARGTHSPVGPSPDDGHRGPPPSPSTTANQQAEVRQPPAQAAQPGSAKTIPEPSSSA